MDNIEVVDKKRIMITKSWTFFDWTLKYHQIHYMLYSEITMELMQNYQTFFESSCGGTTKISLHMNEEMKLYK